MRHRTPQGTRAMIHGVAKIRAAIALVLLSVPYLLLFAAGSIWLFQNRICCWGGPASAWRVRRPAGTCSAGCGTRPSLPRCSPICRGRRKAWRSGSRSSNWPRRSRAKNCRWIGRRNSWPWCVAWRTWWRGIIIRMPRTPGWRRRFRTSCGSWNSWPATFAGPRWVTCPARISSRSATCGDCRSWRASPIARISGIGSHRS